ncbi:hypothetical protein An09g03540 [Aspergillus niger]|uniref:Uncharacterized protein n=2 Tax=Aspergillus niger TaxID=5061 RepID=A2QTW9_ASPNC|nr:hypothetical protein An09g03540 [Aspergillus niger]CAK96797.1 hypothetical protein An09g03540 [Aspergillus niger]
MLMLRAQASQRDISFFVGSLRQLITDVVWKAIDRLSCLIFTDSRCDHRSLLLIRLFQSHTLYAFRSLCTLYSKILDYERNNRAEMLGSAWLCICRVMKCINSYLERLFLRSDANWFFHLVDCMRAVS